MIAVAAFFGFAVAATARWVGAHRLAVALSGLAGPAIVCAGYLFVGPGGELMSGYVAALLAAAVGLLASTATAAVRRGKPKTAGATGALPAAAAGLTPAVLLGTATAAAAAPAARRAIQAAPAPQPAYASAYSQPQYPPSNPASQYLAATGAAAPQYSANAYPTNQYPSQPGWPQPAPAAAATGSVYLAPSRSAPVAPPPVAPPTPVPRVQPVPAPAPPVPPAPPARPATLPPPFTGPPGQPPAPPEPPPQTGRRGAAPKPAAAPRAARAKPAPPPRVAPPDPAPAASAPQATPTVATRTDAPTAKTPAPPASKSKVKQRGKADKTARVPVQPEPVRTEQVTENRLPRTTRPAEVVAVQATKPSPAAEPALPKGRRARRRALKLAAIRAEEEARLAKQRERDAKAMGSREREHVEWLQRLSTLPDDPTLVTRKK
jgi:hypothetical protein